MKPFASALLTLTICLALALPVQAAPLASIPTFTITNVYRDSSITLLTYNMPANHTFDVLMGAMGTRGVGGVRAGTFSSGLGGSFNVQVNIPAALHGSYQIAVRIQSQTKPEIFAYNWFYNEGAGGPITEPVVLPSGKPAPTISIAGAVSDTNVLVATHNFPKDHKFNVLMGYLGTRGVGGLLAKTFITSAASETVLVSIPAALRGQPQIAIRFESANGTSGYYAYTWFANATYGGSGGVPVPGAGVPLPPGVKVLPTFTITSALRNNSVSIYTFNLPPNRTFQVTMGVLGMRGIGGYLVTAFDSGYGGSQALTFSIPPALYGLPEIAIRLQSTTGGYYAYNWFYNR